MLKKRIIPCLDIKDGRTVKGTNFVGLRDAGDPVELAVRYANEGADELVFLDITATVEARGTRTKLVERIGEALNIPFTVGGGVRSVDDARELLLAGADKVAVNSAAIKRPEVVTELANQFGSQAVVAAVDIKRFKESWFVYAKGGREKTSLEAVSWCSKLVELGAGEILLTSMDSDGTKDGFALEITNRIAEEVNVPVIASGGAGSIKDFEVLFTETSASAGLAASIFHFGEIPIPQLKSSLQNVQIPIR